MAKYGLGQSNAIEDVFADPVSDVSSLSSLGDRGENQVGVSQTIKYNNLVSYVPVEQVRSFVFESEQTIKRLLDEVEQNLQLVNINPYLNVEIEKAHKAVIKDAQKASRDYFIQVEEFPNFICYEEYKYASKHKCRSCRALVKEYDLAVIHTTYGHLFNVKKMLENLKNEIVIIKNIVTFYIGESYRDETEAEIAKHFTTWAKTVSHYTKQIAREITTAPTSIPKSELDQISKKQAAQFQAFFSIRINSIVSEIDSIVSLVRRDSVDLSDVFYSNYLIPAMTFRSKLVEPLMLDINVNNLQKKAPVLSGEMFMASNAIVGNLGAVSTDFLERINAVATRLRLFVEAIRLRRRYVNYINQLEFFVVNRTKALVSVTPVDLEKYVNLFSSIPIDESERENLRSSHSDLDDIEGDAHPQYLRRDGGLIIGDIELAEGVKIAGISFANHSHNIEDGSLPISASSIDYVTAREDYYKNISGRAYSNLVLTNINYTPKVGGVHEYSAEFQIEIDDDKINTYDFEIEYKEL